MVRNGDHDGHASSASDGLKLLLVGADVTMVPSELLTGIDQLKLIRNELATWLVNHEYTNIKQLAVRDIPLAFERTYSERGVSSDIQVPST